MAGISVADLLRRYLFMKGNVSVPGIGLLLIETSSARNDFAEKMMYPPESTIRLDSTASSVPDEQLRYMAAKDGTSVELVEQKVKHWADDFSRRLTAVPFAWEGIGTFSRSASGKLLFEPAIPDANMVPPVAYTHIVRENIELTLRVGEEEKTNLEMETYFEEQKRSAFANRWIRSSLALLILALLVLLYRFTLGSFDMTSPRHDPVHPQDPVPGYRIP